MDMNSSEILFAILFALFWLVALAGHILMLKFLLTPYERVKLRLPHGTWPLLLSITIADLAALLLALPFTSLYAIFDGWYYGELICNLSTFVKVASLTMSSYMILALLMHCYEKIKGRIQLSPVKLGLLIGSIWLLALATAFPMLYSHNVIPLDDDPLQNLETFDIEDRDFNLTKRMRESEAEARALYCVPRYHLSHLFSQVTYLYLQFLIPIGIVIFLFIKITDAMNKMVGKSSNKNNNIVELAQQPDVVQLPEDVKFVRTILILAVVFHLFWAPTNFLEMFSGNKWIWICFSILSESTFFIKPLLFFAVNTNFQNALKTIGIPTIDVEDVDGYQVGFSKMDESGVY